MDGSERHIRFYKRYRGLLKPFLASRLGFAADEIETPDGPFLVMANHATDFDPLMLAACFPAHMYFLASEHVYRMGLFSRFIRRYLAPISRVKGASDLSAVKAMLAELKEGHPVAFFPAGSRTFNGESVPIQPAAAKLAIKAKVPLLTVRLTGGYLTTPRWAKTSRKGSCSASLIRTYSPEEMKALGPEALAEAISKDLYVNAYDDQRNHPVEYRGKDLAEGLEETLYTCPECGRTGTLGGLGNVFRCRACGWKTALDPFGFFTDYAENDGPVYRPLFGDVLTWDRWQKKELETLVKTRKERAAPPSDDPADNPPDEPIFRDPGFVLESLEGDSEEFLESGELSMGLSTLRIGSRVFPYEKLDGFSVIHRKGTESLVFSSEGIHYQLSSETAASRYKYYTLWTILQKI